MTATGWPGWSDAWAGPQEVVPTPTSLVERKAHRGGAFTSVVRHAHRAGAWRPIERYRLPTDTPPNQVTATLDAVFGFDAVLDGDPVVPVSSSLSANFGFTATLSGQAVTAAATTVVNITDLLMGAETLDDPVDNTATMQKCLDRIVLRKDTAAGITTDHVTIDFENRYWICENPVEFPNDADLLSQVAGHGSVGHPCQKWPKGIKWQNGGIRQNTDDGPGWDYKNTTTTSANTFIGVVVTTLTGSQTVPAAPTTFTLTVASTAAFVDPDQELVIVNTGTNAIGTRVSYTGKDATHFTGCVVISGSTGSKAGGLEVRESFNVAVVSTANFTDPARLIRVGDKDLGTRLNWQTKTTTVFRGCYRMGTATGTVSSPSGATVYQDPYPANRNRKGVVFSQSVQRPSGANAQQMIELENWWFKGAHTLAKPDYMLAREGQEAIELAGTQWIKFTDCKIEETWADAFNVTWHASTINGRDNDVYPGMIEILGGLIHRPGIMHLTANQFRCPDAVVTPGFWKNDPDHITVPRSVNDAPSASGTQYGIWWHGNAAHPFQGGDSSHSIIDIEPQGSYGHACDFRLGADDSKANFRFDFPNVGGGNFFLSAGDGMGLMYRHKFQHIFMGGVCRLSWGGSTTIGYRQSAVAATSNGVTLPTGTIHCTNANLDTSGAAIINVAGLGATLVKYTGRTGSDLTGCTGGVGTLATSATMRGARVNHRYFGANVAAGSNGVVLGAKNSPVGGGGFLYLDNLDDFAFASWVRVWAAGTGTPFFLKYVDVDPPNSRLTGVTVFTGTGVTLQTGQAVTWAFVGPERGPYCVGELEVLDFEHTQAGGEVPGDSTGHADGLKVTKCKGPVRSSEWPPFSDLNDVINFDNGPGTDPNGDNTFTKI